MNTFDEIIDSATHDLVQSHGFIDVESAEYKTVFEGRRDTLISDFNDKVDLNNITPTILNRIKDMVSRGEIKDTKQTAVVSLSNIHNQGFLDFIQFVKNNPELEYFRLNNKSDVLVTKLSPFKALQMSEYLKNSIVYLTLSLKNLEKYFELIKNKVISISSDSKLHNKNKTYKISVRVAANVDSSEANRRRDHYANVILSLAKGLREKGYDTYIGNSGGNIGHSLTIYTDNIPSLNIFKLYRLSNITIGVRDDLKIVTDEEFENIFKDLL